MRRKKRITGILGLIMAAVLMCSGCRTSEMNKELENNSSALEEEQVSKGAGGYGIPIVFSEDGITTSATTGVMIEDNVVTIMEAGSYELSGTCSDARVAVTVDKEEEVELILNGLDLTCSNYAPIVVTQAGEVTINLAEGSVNRIADGEPYDLIDSDDTTDAAIFSRDDLKLKGDGTLNIYANYNHGIVAKDDLEIKGGTYLIEAAADGINANDSITIDGGTFYISAGDDGMHVDEIFTLNDGDIIIAESYEGIEGHQVIIHGGTVNIIASDDGINSSSGDEESTSTLDSEPDVMELPEKTDGQPEGIEFPEMTGGQSEGMEFPEKTGGQPEDMEFPEGVGKMTADMDADADSLIQINNGVITVDAGGDGLDSNGGLEINGGVIYVSGATNSGDSVIDYGIQAYVNGGVLIAAGYSGMAEQFSNDSEQCSLMYASSDVITAGTLLTLIDVQENELVSWEVPKECNCIIISTPDLKIGDSYTLKIGNDAEEIEITDVNNLFGNSVSGSQPGGF